MRLKVDNPLLLSVCLSRCRVKRDAKENAVSLVNLNGSGSIQLFNRARMVASGVVVTLGFVAK